MPWNFFRIHKLEDEKRLYSKFLVLQIKEVVIPSNVEKIGAHAFVECNNLKRIVIKSKKLKKVGSRAFADMGKDAVIYIPKERETEYRKMIEDSTAHAQIIAQ